MSPVDHDVAFVGGGFRTTTFLASAPHLLRHRLAVFERGSVIGPGGFADYSITSTSVGSRFLRQVRYDGALEPLRHDPVVSSVATAEQPVRMPNLAAALAAVGERVVEALGELQVRLNTEVREIDIDLRRDLVRLIAADGSSTTARHVVVATGRRERRHAELTAWQDKTLLSSEVISIAGRQRMARLLGQAHGKTVVIAGSSHSAMSAVSVIVELCAQQSELDPDFVPPQLFVLRRGEARLMYESAEIAGREQVAGRELLFEPARNVCPESGIVFRDSGLRHESKKLYLDLWEGRVPHGRIVPIARLGEAKALLDDAAFVVQALGYHGHAPDVHVEGRLVRASDSTERFTATSDGAALLDGLAQPNLSVLRVEPTPQDQRDNHVYGSRLYADLASRIERLMTSEEAVR